MGIINSGTIVRLKVAAQQRAYREANREKVAAYQRAYRRRKREEAAQCPT